MTAAEEILEQIDITTHEHAVSDTDKTFTIDPFTRQIIADSGQKTILIQGDAVINSVKSVDSNIKVCVALTIPPNYSQDAFGKNYKCNQTRARYKRNNVLWVANQIERYDNREDEGIYIIPIYSNLDTKYNMGMEVVQYNKRNPETYWQPIANGGVHPVDSGYWQIADVYWFFLKAQEI